MKPPSPTCAKARGVSAINLSIDRSINQSINQSNKLFYRNRRNRETWHRETWQRGTRSNSGARTRFNRIRWTISELNFVCHDSTAALIATCSVCVQTAILSALVRSPYGVPRDDNSSSSNISEDEDRRQAAVRAGIENFRGVGIGNGSRGNSRGRLLRTVPRGATCSLRTDAVRTCAVLWSVRYAYVSYGWGMSCLVMRIFILRRNVDHRAGQLSLPHIRITETEKIELKYKTDERISPVNGLEPWDLSDRQKQTRVEDKIITEYHISCIALSEQRFPGFINKWPGEV